MAIHPDSATRQWLDRIGDPEETPVEYLPPAEANQYINLIGKQQKAIEKNCPPVDGWKSLLDRS